MPTLSVQNGDRPAQAAGGRSDVFAVTRLTLTDFRNFGALRVTVALDRSMPSGQAMPIVLTGANGVGKTNLLEALSLLAPGPGLRGARASDLSRRVSADAPNSSGWAVAATVRGPNGAVDIGTGRALSTNGEGTRRALRIDGAQARNQAELAEHVNVQWLTPQMDRLFIDAPASRRRFLDRMIYGLDPGHARRVAAYQRVMRARMRLLRQGGHPAWLDAIEDTMAAHAVAVAAARREYCTRLAAALTAGFGPFPGAAIAVTGAVERSLADHAAVDVESDLRAALATGRSHDRDSGTTGHGPHRSDLEVRHLEKDFAAGQCSTGEQKALLLAIFLANARLHAVRGGRMPVLLLDEVAAHLDAGRCADLIEALCSLGAQAWLTGTDPHLFAVFGERARFLTLKKGCITETDPLSLEPRPL